jgi:hypothetical protein
MCDNQKALNSWMTCDKSVKIFQKGSSVAQLGGLFLTVSGVCGSNLDAYLINSKCRIREAGLLNSKKCAVDTFSE